MGWGTVGNILLGGLPSLFGLGKNKNSAQTPGINPAADTPDASGSGSGGTDWTEILPYLLNAGTNILGTGLQARAQGQNNAALQQRALMFDRLAQEDRKRRDYYASLLLPNLLRGTGFSKDQIAQRMKSNPISGG